MLLLKLLVVVFLFRSMYHLHGTRVYRFIRFAQSRRLSGMCKRCLVGCSDEVPALFPYTPKPN